MVGITVYEHDPLIIDELENLRGICGDFLVDVADHQPIEQTNILERLKPDLYLGHRGDNVWAAKQGIPLASIFQHYHSIYRALNAAHLSISFPIFDRLVLDRTYGGYKGATMLMEDIYSAVVNSPYPG